MNEMRGMSLEKDRSGHEDVVIHQDSLCWRCSRVQGFYETPCFCGAINPNVDLDGALAQQGGQS